MAAGALGHPENCRDFQALQSWTSHTRGFQLPTRAFFAHSEPISTSGNCTIQLADRGDGRTLRFKLRRHSGLSTVRYTLSLDSGEDDCAAQSYEWHKTKSVGSQMHLQAVWTLRASSRERAGVQEKASPCASGCRF